MWPPLTAARTSFLLLTGFLLFSFFYNLSLPPIYIWDEARRANDALQLYVSGDWIIDYYDDNPETWSTKSPILLWLQVFCLKLFGLSEWAIRLPSAIAGTAIGIIIWLFGKWYFQNAWLGFLAGSVFAGTYAWVFMHAGRTGDYDALLSLFSTLYCCCFYLFTMGKGNRWLRGFWLFLTLAVLIKGVAGLFFLPSMVLFTISQKRLNAFLKNKWFYMGFICFAGTITGYYLLREWHAPGFLQAVYDNELGGRYLTELEGHGLTFTYYFKTIISWRYTYWSLFLIPAFSYGFLSSLAGVRKITLYNFLLVAGFLLIISSARTKLSWYDLPIYPFLSIQIGIFLYATWQQLQQKYLYHYSIKIKMITAVALFVLAFIIPFRGIYIHNLHVLDSIPWDVHVEERQQGRFLQQAIRHNRDLNNYIFYYNGYNAHIAFYIKILQLKKVDVQLTDHLNAIHPNQHIVVSQDSLEKKLQNSYAVKSVEKAFGCSVFMLR